MGTTAANVTETSQANKDINALRQEVRDFVAQNLNQDVRNTTGANGLPSRDQWQRWQRKLNEKGWAAPGWPKEYGGTGWSLEKQAVLREELLFAGAPVTDTIGITIVGPTIIHHGTEEQKERFLPRMLNMDDHWAQAYSEPGAGSDLASLKCAAVREGEEYIINGNKIWQSHAHWSDWALTLVRTGPPEPRKQAGISVMLVNLKSPGVTVRPIKFMNGAPFHCELFFDDVRVPADCLLGAEGDGWRVAQSLLMVERLFLGRVPETILELRKVRDRMRTSGPGGSDLAGDPVYAARYRDLAVRLSGYEAAWWAAVDRAEKGAIADSEISMQRIIGTQLLQDVHELHLDVCGAAALKFDPAAIEEGYQPPADSDPSASMVTAHYYRFRGITLGGGSTEIQREISARDIFRRGTVQHAWPMSEEKQMLADTVARLLANEYDFETRQKIVTDHACDSDQAWTAMAELGVLGLMAPENQGGFGGALADLCIVAEQTGASLVSEPWLWNAVAGVRLATAAEDVLAIDDIISGQSRLAVAWREASNRNDRMASETRAEIRDGVWCVSGTKDVVAGGSSANHLIVSALTPDDELALLVVDAKDATVSMDMQVSSDERPAAGVRFEATPARLIANEPKATALLDQVLDHMALASCAEAVGAMGRALDITVGYLQERQQFGRSLAEFQALRHRVVDAAVDLYRARSILSRASGAFGDVEQAGSPQLVAATCLTTTRVARRIGHEVLQLHGAIAFQDETEISHYAKRLMLLPAHIGDEAFWSQRWSETGGQD